jgi:hypothetical protein
MIEDRLRETLDLVATGGPDEAGAFDRFQRHRRAHRSRRVAGATAVVLVAALVSAVAVPRLLSRAPERRLVATGAAGPERWLAGPLTAVAPLQGFEVEVPEGWEANATWKGIELRPAAPDRRRHLDGPVQLVTSTLEEFYSPAPNAWKDGSYEDRSQTQVPRQVTRQPEGRQSRGSFPGDNRWFRTDLQEGRWRTTQWHIAWPYRCQPGVPCPAQLALRTLKVVFQVDGDGAAQVDRLAERLLRTARPITNAVKGQSHAPRPACVDGRSMVLRRDGGDSVDIDFPGPVTVAKFYWWARTTANLVPCTVRGPFGVELLDESGRRLEVQGNGLTVTTVADLPEARSIYTGAGVTELQLKWFNWCGTGPTRMRWIGAPGAGQAVPITAPRCIDRSKPSRLMVEHILR